MGHKKSTADRYYYLEEEIESSDRAAEALPLIMRRSAPGEPCYNKEESDQKLSPIEEQAERKWTTFSIGEIEEIQNTFSLEIKEWAPVTMDQVRKKWRQISIYMGRIQEGFMIKYTDCRKSRKSSVRWVYPVRRSH